MRGSNLRFNFGKILLCFAWLHFSCVAVCAQSPATIIYNQSSGLVCNEVYDVLQDRLGFIWIATDRGVYRFDGYRFDSYTTAQGLTDNTVFCLEEDRFGRIWALPFNGRLCYVENNRVTEYIYNDSIARHLEGFRVARSLHVLEDSSLQIGFLLHGIIHVTADGEIEFLTEDDQTGVDFHVMIGSEQQLLTGTYTAKVHDDENALHFVSPTFNKTITTSGRHERQQIIGLQLQNSTWCFAFNRSLMMLDPSGISTELHLPAQPMCMIQDREGFLWLGFYERGIRRYAVGTTIDTTSYEEFFPDEIITSIMEDKEGGIWICTHHNGLLYAPYVHVKAWEHSLGYDDEVIAFHPGRNNVVYALWRDHGLSAIIGNKMKEYAVLAPAGELYTCITYNGRSNTVLAGTTQGIVEFNPVDENARLIAARAPNSLLLCEDELFCGLSWNLGVINARGELRTVGDPRVRHRPDVLYKDASGRLWMGALDGLYEVKDSTYIHYSEKHTLLGRRIAAICELSDSTLLVATQSSGIVLLNKSGIRTITQSEKFKCEHIVAAVPGNNNSCWVTTYDGLYRLTISDDSVMSDTQPGINELLDRGGPCYYSPVDSLLWTSSGNRILSFNPELRNASPAPPVYIRSVSVNDSSYSNATTAQLASDQNFIRITYAGLVYRLHGEVTYRYRLNENEEWNYTMQNEVELAALSAGEYKFEIQAQNELGEWSERPATFAFIIHPAFWNTRWFRFGLLIIFALLIYTTVRIRFHIIRRRDLLRERALMFRQQALASQMNPHFVFNALNTIQSYVLKENKTQALDMFTSFATLLRKSLEQAGERSITLTEEIDTLRLYFELEAMRFEKLDYDIIVDSTIDPERILVPAMLVQPMAENAIKHGIQHKASRGKVTVRFCMVEDSLVCEVTDDGIGRKASTLLRQPGRKHSGIKITEDRLRVLAEMNKSEFRFEIIDREHDITGAAEGTTIHFIIPHTDKFQSRYEKA